MKKIFITIVIFLFLQSCGYVPIYSKNQKINFYIESVNFKNGDDELSNYIDLNLINYTNKRDGKKYKIDANVQYLKTVISKNTAGKAEKYELISNVSFTISSLEEIKKINMREIFRMNNFDDEFEERQYEQEIKKNMARSIVSRLLLQLSRFNDN